MQALAERKVRCPDRARLAAAYANVLEALESRVLMSTAIAGWNFTAVESAGMLTQVPPQVPGGVTVTNHQTSGTPTLTAIGMTESGTTDNEDITAPGGTINGSGSAVGRRRGTGSGSNGDTNGWWTSAPEYSQGTEIDVNTSGYSLNNLTFDWFTTTSGPRDLMVQYNLNTGNSAGWTNALSSPLAAVSNNWDGSTTPTNTVDLTGLPAGAGNDPNFGLRLVSAYDPNFPGSTEYSSAKSNNTSQTQIANTGGNWSFNNISVTGTAASAR